MMTDSERPVVLVGVADDDSGRPVLAQALNLTARLHGTLVVTHVSDTPLPAGAALPASGMAGAAVIAVDPEEAQQAERARLDEEEAWIRRLHDVVAAGLKLSDVPWSYQSASGDPGHALVDLARLVRPSVSHTVIGEREVPVLVVPHGMPTGAAADAV